MSGSVSAGTGRRVVTVATAAVLAAGGIAACTSTTGDHVRLSVSPGSALYDTPVTVRLSGLSSGEHVTLRTSSKASTGVTWSASAAFAADHAGVVSIARAPLSGSYVGANAMGLFEDEAPNGNEDTEANFVPSDHWTIDVTATAGGHQVAKSAITRLEPTQLGVRGRALRPATDGVYGEMYEPRSTSSPHPAVVVFGGSEGGLSVSSEGELLAAHGYPALALAYFHEPGLPANLEKIPIEYFAKALRLLAKQPGVDPKRMLVWGDSRGSEAAELTSVHYPTLVAATALSVPSDVAYIGIPDTSVAAWTFGGRAVLTAPRYLFGQVDAALTRPYQISVTKIRGPIFAVCGTGDAIWPSCSFSSSIKSQLATAHSHYPPTVLEYAGAGHFVGSLRPYVPSTASSGTTANGEVVAAGGTPTLDEAARAAGWPKLLAFINSTPSLPT